MPLEWRDRALALRELPAASERAIPARESVPLMAGGFCVVEPAAMPPLAVLSDALRFMLAFALPMVDALLPLAIPFCEGPPFWVRLPFCVLAPFCVRLPFDGMLPFELPFELPFIELTDALPFVLGVFMLADDPAFPDDIPACPPSPPVPAAITGAASNPNAHTEANNPAFNMGRSFLKDASRDQPAIRQQVGPAGAVRPSHPVARTPRHSTI
jgi:hypothetical protein